MPFKTQHPLYPVWHSMKARCTNPNNPSWHRYGGRGISVCARWSEYGTGFQNFLADMGERPQGFTLDRIDNNKGYNPENCRWTTRKQQQWNMEATRSVTIGGVEYVVAEVAYRYGFKPDTLFVRAKTAQSFDEWVDRSRRVYRPGLALGGKAIGKKKRAMTHCSNGHEYTDETTLITKEGWRRCRTCHSNRMRERTARLKA